MCVCVHVCACGVCVVCVCGVCVCVCVCIHGCVCCILCLLVTYAETVLRSQDRKLRNSLFSLKRILHVSITCMYCGVTSSCDVIMIFTYQLYYAILLMVVNSLCTSVFVELCNK